MLGVPKKRYHDSRRSTVERAQTQNKTRQNYYAIFPVYAGGGVTSTIYVYSHTHKQLFRSISIHLNEIWHTHICSCLICLFFRTSILYLLNPSFTKFQLPVPMQNVKYLPKFPTSFPTQFIVRKIRVSPIPFQYHLHDRPTI